MGPAATDTVNALFRTIAARTPGAVALIDARTCVRVTYRELDQRSNEVAHALRARGVVPDELVGLCLPRSIDAVVAILGILKSGAAYLPLDPGWPRERLELHLAAAKVRVALCASDGRKNLEGGAADLLDAGAFTTGDPREVEAVNGPEHLAYAMVTSGSTGEPKAVAVPHRAIVRLVQGQDYAAFGPDETLLAMAPLSFDASTFELWGALLHGGRLVVMDSSQPSLDEIAWVLRDQEVTTLWLTAGLFAAMADERLDALAGLRQLLTGGDVLPVPQVRRVLERFPSLKLINGYGPTECTTFACCHRVLLEDCDRPIPIGTPLRGTTAHVVDEESRPLADGREGELLLGGDGLARGYLGKPHLTSDKFITSPWGERVYRTGDVVRRRPGGVLEFVGRRDGQVKIRGFRVELGEIEAALRQHPSVAQAAVAVSEPRPGDKRLAAFVVPRNGAIDPARLRSFLAEKLPAHLLPSSIAPIAELPLGPTGKVDRKKLAATPVAPAQALEESIAAIFRDVLGRPSVGLHDNFFDLGATSLTLLTAHARVAALGAGDISITSLFANPTVAALSLALRSGGAQGGGEGERRGGSGRDPIAIIGMSGRFPGARSVDELWRNVKAGVESIRRFEPDEIEARDPAALRKDPAYVRARGILEGVDLFDAGFFGVPPREADLMDPQHRVFLECCWEAMEDAGVDSKRAGGGIGVFAGQSLNTYLLSNVGARREALDQIAGEYQVGSYTTVLGNDKDYLATRVSYKLDLSGPAMTVQSACSTSLVAVVQAVNALRAGQCEAALAGGVSITFPQKRGYLYAEGGMVAPDGHCRAFDAAAAGTVFSSGAGVVLLKRLSDALADGDRIYAVIRGAAINNDGALKVGYSAPSPERQAAVIAAAHRDAGVDPSTIGLVETHGTGTPLGDPIEFAGLTKAFGSQTSASGFCALGALKTNVGHMEVASGVSGLIKAALSVREGVLPPVLHFQKANPGIHLEGSPFYVNADLRPWPRCEHPRRAGVSSFGVGGTNAHLVIEEPPRAAAPAAARRTQVIVLSAKSAAAADAACAELAKRLEADPGIDLADAAYTLQIGRRAFAHRRAVVASSREASIAGLRGQPLAAVSPEKEPAVAFLFPGQGAQHVGMARELYDSEPSFRGSVDECASLLKPALGLDLRDAIFRGTAEQLSQTWLTQPAIFVVEYALARLWMKLGVAPRALVGHSVGEYVAATLAGVFELGDALSLVAARGRLIQDLPGGAMLAVRLAEEKLAPLLPGDISIAAVNAPQLCVAAGPHQSIAALEAKLTARDVVARRLRTSHAFHSAMMDPALPAFAERVAKVALKAPSIPIVSTCTGAWMRPEDATSADYWVRHVRQPVRFAPAIAELRKSHDGVLLEVGPGRTLTQLVRQGAPAAAGPAIATLGDAAEPGSDEAAFHEAVGRLWLAGARIDWTALHGGRRARVSLPAYRFERKRHFIDPPGAAAPPPAPQPIATRGGPTMSARKDRLLPELRSLLEDASGLDLDGSDPAATFLELGLDSLFLTQFALAVQSKYGAKVAFRQLLEQIPSLAALAHHLDKTLPPEAAPPPAPLSQFAQLSPIPDSNPIPNPTAASVAPATAPAGSVQAVIEEQLRLMSRQLDLLRGAPPAQPAVASAPAINAPAMTEAVQIAAAPPVIAAPRPPAEDASHQKYDPKKAFGAIARIHTHHEELTPKQKARLEALIRRYTARTRRSKEFTEQNRARLSDPRVVTGFRPAIKELVYPIVVSRSKGARMWDLDGNDYVDALNGFGSNFFGYQPDFIAQALKEQIDLGYEVGPQHPLAAECADLVCDLTGHDRAAFCNTGSEAVLGCVRIARTVTGRRLVAFFSGSYHGIFDEVVARAGKKKSIPGAPGIMPSAMENSLILDYGTPESLQILKERAGELAAILVEPIQSRRPDFQPREFLHELRKLTEQSGTALIFDEVITGFRLHQGGAQAHFGVQADLASYGKVVSAGIPIGVIAGKKSWMDALDGGPWKFGDGSVPSVGVTYFAGTFVRHPLALAACKAALAYLKEQGPGLQQKLNERTTAMVAELNAFCRKVSAPIEVRSFSSLWKAFYLDEQPFGDLLFVLMRDRGVHILDGFPCFLTIAHGEEEVARIVTAFKESVIELQESGFLPGASKPAGAVDPAAPPAPGARLGRDPSGNPAWYVPHASEPGKFVKIDA